jgi:hypothetical protein
VTDEQGIFLEIGGELHLLEEQPYEREDVLQEALERHPQVIAGVTTTDGRRVELALVKREIGVPSQEGGSQVWSLDHLFVDAEGVPVLVEVKRSSDTRIRREVVGQMLDYAANGTKYWPVGELRRAFEARMAAEELDADSWLAERFGVDDADEYWRRVEHNLRGGQLRLVFVADRLPSELVRIIEYLNEQMHDTEVLGVELRQYRGADTHRAFVPSVVGRTSRAVDAKTPEGSTRRWDRDSFLQVARERRTAEEVALIERIFRHIEDRGGYPKWGGGATPGMSGWYPIDGVPRPVFNLNVNADVAGRQAYFSLYAAELFRRIGRSKLEQALTILEEIDAFRTGVAETRAADYVKWPSIFLPSIAGNGGQIATLLRALDALVDGPGSIGDAASTVHRPGGTHEL